ncbi:uncharacterized protein [Fopius arisanus]|uniref:Uncharacterized protein n=1 Tax=Fopius arisanus TaxID=64838 RepID=A0A9R1TQ24_9HYME|nr:PREDICTED: uncharacterized protein LOC105273910 [Fopius arisanus]XP_011314929.1 PREDICTED: uncharacterized protein LOC105273910 [Fopius arisanus]
MIKESLRLDYKLVVAMARMPRLGIVGSGWMEGMKKGEWIKESGLLVLLAVIKGALSDEHEYSSISFQRLSSVTEILPPHLLPVFVGFQSQKERDQQDGSLQN